MCFHSRESRYSCQTNRFATNSASRRKFQPPRFRGNPFKLPKLRSSVESSRTCETRPLRRGVAESLATIVPQRDTAHRASPRTRRLAPLSAWCDRLPQSSCHSPRPSPSNLLRPEAAAIGLPGLAGIRRWGALQPADATREQDWTSESQVTLRQAAGKSEGVVDPFVQTPRVAGPAGTRSWDSRPGLARGTQAGRASGTRWNPQVRDPPRDL